MSSCSGMRDIHLIIHKYKTDDRAYQFYTQILPRHAHTLTSLKIPVERDGLWCFGAHAIHALSKCKQLISLTVTVTHKDLTQKPFETITSVINMAAELPLLSDLSIFTSGLGCDICGVGDRGSQDEIY
ncbi:hypothetical protein BD779DRAFT_628093 [Infundibulicybe gibba]|nr:hypothetical protein BD779DRAFT_628093 [Infundibulicybe gibba]